MRACVSTATHCRANKKSGSMNSRPRQPAQRPPRRQTPDGDNASPHPDSPPPKPQPDTSQSAAGMCNDPPEPALLRSEPARSPAATFPDTTASRPKDTGAFAANRHQPDTWPITPRPPKQLPKSAGHWLDRDRKPPTPPGKTSATHKQHTRPARCPCAKQKGISPTSGPHGPGPKTPPHTTPAKAPAAESFRGSDATEWENSLTRQRHGS